MRVRAKNHTEDTPHKLRQLFHFEITSSMQSGKHMKNNFQLKILGLDYKVAYLSILRHLYYIRIRDTSFICDRDKRFLVYSCIFKDTNSTNHIQVDNTFLHQRAILSIFFQCRAAGIRETKTTCRNHTMYMFIYCTSHWFVAETQNCYLTH